MLSSAVARRGCAAAPPVAAPPPPPPPGEVSSMPELVRLTERELARELLRELARLSACGYRVGEIAGWVVGGGRAVVKGGRAAPGCVRRRRSRTGRACLCCHSVTPTLPTLVMMLGGVEPSSRRLKSSYDIERDEAPEVEAGGIHAPSGPPVAVVVVLGLPGLPSLAAAAVLVPTAAAAAASVVAVPLGEPEAAAINSSAWLASIPTSSSTCAAMGAVDGGGSVQS